MTKSDLERAFLTYWKQLAPDYDEPEQQYKFHPKRRWRLDFAWPRGWEYPPWIETENGPRGKLVLRSPVAVELHGGTWSGGRHVRGEGFRKDREKMNAATSTDWRVFEFTTGMLEDDPVGCIEMVKDALDS